MSRFRTPGPLGKRAYNVAASLVQPQAGAHSPWADGQVATYIFTEIPNKELSKYLDNINDARSRLDMNRRAIFVNGMGNSGEDHAMSARVLSLFQLCPVIGVYNRQSDFWGDVAQCLRDKIKFQLDSIGDPAKAFNSKWGSASPELRVAAMEAILGEGKLGNKATAALFRLLAVGEGKNPTYPIFAHSQGNLILSNALQALEIVFGKGHVAGRQINSFGSPAVKWPEGIDHRVHAFTFDLVSLMDPVPSWSISKVGMPDGEWNPFTHGFLYYLKEDAGFIINRHRTGPKHVTISMDEEKLAEELASFANNEPRLLRVFRRLRDLHASDSDDVAFEYVQALRRSGNASILKSMPQLVALLIELLESGVTFPSEREVIDFLKAQK